MIDPKAIVESKEVVALADVFKNPLINRVIIIGALISMFGINVAASFHTPRILESMAKQKQVPDVFAKRTENGFPMLSFLLTIAIAIIIPLAFKFDMTSIMIISSISRFVQFLIVPLALITFYLGKERGKVNINVNKSMFLDAIIPVIAIIFTLLLLIKFDWVGQFTIKDTDGNSTTNIFAIISMLIGYVFLPLVLMAWKKMRLSK